MVKFLYNLVQILPILVQVGASLRFVSQPGLETPQFTTALLVSNRLLLLFLLLSLPGYFVACHHPFPFCCRQACGCRRQEALMGAAMLGWFLPVTR